MNKINFLKSLRKREAGITLPDREERLKTLDEIIDEVTWIPCDKRMPEERDSVFKRFKGTYKWNEYMFEKSSAYVLVTMVFPSGEKLTLQSKTLDGKWKTEFDEIGGKVIAWKPFPKPMEDEE